HLEFVRVFIGGLVDAGNDIEFAQHLPVHAGGHLQRRNAAGLQVVVAAIAEVAFLAEEHATAAQASRTDQHGTGASHFQEKVSFHSACYRQIRPAPASTSRSSR